MCDRPKYRGTYILKGMINSKNQEIFTNMSFRKDSLFKKSQRLQIIL